MKEMSQTTGVIDGAKCKVIGGVHGKVAFISKTQEGNCC
jgi:hypothetical protein